MKRASFMISAIVLAVSCGCPPESEPYGKTSTSSGGGCPPSTAPIPCDDAGTPPPVCSCPPFAWNVVPVLSPTLTLVANLGDRVDIRGQIPGGVQVNLPPATNATKGQSFQVVVYDDGSGPPFNVSIHLTPSPGDAVRGWVAGDVPWNMAQTAATFVNVGGGFWEGSAMPPLMP